MDPPDPPASVAPAPAAGAGGRFALQRSPFPPIAGYGFLSDREVTALVAPGGNVEWLCLPRPDSPSVLAANLDRAAGGFRLGPADVMVPAGRRYLPGTMVLETTWQTRTGWLIVRDALTIGPWYSTERLVHYKRPPGDHQAEHCLLRTVKCVNGQVELALNCEPVFDYGQVEAQWDYTDLGYQQGIAKGGYGHPELRLTTSLRLAFEGRSAHAFSTLTEGDSAFAALTWSDELPPPLDFDEAADRMWRTGNYWREWMHHGEFPDHPWRNFLQRSALTLKGLTYVPTGALLAAATTSLPETPGGERNWDYRYSWIRDATFGLWGLYTLGFDYEANNFFYFIADSCGEDEDLQPMYAVGGERELDERTLDHLSGYDGARPVRIGNAAYKQKQHDVWGFPARLGLSAHAVPGPSRGTGVAAAQAVGGGRHRQLA
jgi:GH15 family glucan-1,4-alpha-glucosidase